MVDPNTADQIPTTRSGVWIQEKTTCWVISYVDIGLARAVFPTLWRKISLRFKPIHGREQS